MSVVKDCVEAWMAGKVVLHPTDTIPGLSFNPYSPAAEKSFFALKARPTDKSPIALVASWESAARCWQTLPLAWEEILKTLWPSSLSVIWKASDRCPKSIVTADGTCALRMPNWSKDNEWMHQVLVELNTVFPSSSVNLSGQAAAEDWKAALATLEKLGSPVHVPKLTPRQVEAIELQSHAPSTVIRIETDGSWSIVRQGALSREAITKKWERYAKRT